MDHNNVTLLNAFRSGDQEAFATLYVRHQALVRAVCARVAAPGEADDCVQSVFLVLSRRPAAAAAAPTLEAWLLRVAWHVARCSRRDWRRRLQREAACATPTVVEARPDSEALEHLTAALQRLPERQRQAVFLQYAGGQSPEAIAVVLGVTRNHAYQLTHRGLEGLRTFLARRGFPVTTAVLVTWFGQPAQAQDISIVGLVRVQRPSPLVSHLAQGAQRMLDLTRLLPPMAAAAALVPLMAVGLWTAEAVTPPPSAVDLHITAMPAVALVEQVAAQLRTTVRWDDRVDRQALPQVTLALDHLPPAEALAHVAKALGVRARREDAGWVLEPLPGVVPLAMSPSTTATAVTATAVTTDQDRAVWEVLQQSCSLELEERDLRSVIETWNGITTARFATTPAVDAFLDIPITIRADKARLHHIVQWVCDMHGLAYRVQGGRVVIDVKPAGTTTTSAGGRTLADVMAHPQDDTERQIASRLEPRVTVDFQEQSFVDAMRFSQMLSGLNLVLITPSRQQQAKPITVRFQNGTIASLLTTIADHVGWTVSVQHGAIYLIARDL